ncbi:hypothetical protein Fmac_015130 [Flemingia macrophylla]|uniref:Uncharacterized protein n=1 Tax=Flemingia macrophylla TaxID=520843 RepID=A0ABD1ME76_9FABA
MSVKGSNQTSRALGRHFDCAINRSSKLVGISEGTSITSNVDELQNISIAKLILSLKPHKGSISVVGAINHVKP